MMLPHKTSSSGGASELTATTINVWEVAPHNHTRESSISSPSTTTFLAPSSHPAQLAAHSTSTSLAVAAALKYRQRQVDMQLPDSGALSAMLHSSQPHVQTQIPSSIGDSPAHAPMSATSFTSSKAIPQSSSTAAPASLPLKLGVSSLYGSLRSNTPASSYLAAAPAGFGSTMVRPAGSVCRMVSHPPLPGTTQTAAASCSKLITDTNSTGGADSATDHTDMMALLLSAATLCHPEGTAGAAHAPNAGFSSAAVHAAGASAVHAAQAPSLAAAAAAGMPGHCATLHSMAASQQQPAAAAGLWVDSGAAAGSSNDMLLQGHAADLMQQLHQLQTNQATKAAAAAAAAASGSLLGDCSSMFASDQPTPKQQLTAATAIASAPLLSQIPAHIIRPQYASAAGAAAGAAAAAAAAATPVLAGSHATAAHIPNFGLFGAAAMNVSGLLQNSSTSLPALLSQLPAADRMDTTVTAAGVPSASPFLVMSQLPASEMHSYRQAANNMLTAPNNNMQLPSRQGLQELQGAAASQLLASSSNHNSHSMLAGATADAASSTASGGKGEHSHHHHHHRHHGSGSPHIHCGPNNALYKTELCRTWLEAGSCRYGSRCQFAHGEHELRPVARPAKYKTQPCRTFSLTGKCPYGARCNFIHGEAHLQQQLGWLGRISSSGSSCGGGSSVGNVGSSSAAGGDAGSSNGLGATDASVFIGPATGSLFGTGTGSTGKGVVATAAAAGGSGDAAGGSCGAAAGTALPGLGPLFTSSGFVGSGNGSSCVTSDGFAALSALAAGGGGPMSNNSNSSSSFGGIAAAAAAAAAASPLMMGSFGGVGGEAAPGGAGMGQADGGVGAFGPLLLR